jgi:hypothetical protein
MQGSSEGFRARKSSKEFEAFEVAEADHRNERLQEDDLSEGRDEWSEFSEGDLRNFVSHQISWKRK